MSDMNRRQFITLLGGATAWPLAVDAQQPERMRRIGVLMTGAAGDPEGQARLTGFLQGLQALGWTAGRNARIDYRWAEDDASRGKYAAELVALTPDVILASTARRGVHQAGDSQLKRSNFWDAPTDEVEERLGQGRMALQN